MPVRRFGRWLAAALLLVVVDLVVRGPVFRHYIGPHYVDAGLFPRDRTNGHTWEALFDGVVRGPRPALRVGIVGDSTVFGTIGLEDDTAPAWFLLQALRRRLPEATVEVVDVSTIGLYANDAVFLMNKLLSPEYDVLIYGLTLRALPNLDGVRWSRNLASELSPSEIGRIFAAGGGEWFRTGVSGSEVLASTIQSAWGLYAYRAILKRMMWHKVVARVLSPWPSLVEGTRPLSFAPPWPGQRPELLPGKTEWSREGYAIPNSNWTALEIIGGLCARYGPGRCLLYSGATNPFGRDRLTEPGHYEEYLVRLRILAGRYGLRFRDFTDALAADEFRPLKFPWPGDLPQHDPIHMNVTGAAKLMEYVADTVIDMARPGATRVALAAPAAH